MRIGNMDDPHQSDGLAELIETSDPGKLTKTEKRKNWWHYHKWHVITVVILLAALFHILGTALGLFTKSPDLQIAYVSTAPLPEDTAAALEEAFASLIEDFNRDGEVIVQIHQYVGDPNAINAETAYYQYASEITLIGDISDCESYLFLLEEPEYFQQDYQVLAMPDGSCPGDADYSIDGKAIKWADCPLLSSLDLGAYSLIAAGQEITGDNQEFLKDFYLGRRCFPTDKTTDHVSECAALWDKIIANSTTPVT